MLPSLASHRRGGYCADARSVRGRLDPGLWVLAGPYETGRRRFSQVTPAVGLRLLELSPETTTAGHNRSSGRVRRVRGPEFHTGAQTTPPEGPGCRCRYAASPQGRETAAASIRWFASEPAATV
jgi:hypothetical protein